MFDLFLLIYLIVYVCGVILYFLIVDVDFNYFFVLILLCCVLVDFMLGWVVLFVFVCFVLLVEVMQGVIDYVEGIVLDVLFQFLVIFDCDQCFVLVGVVSDYVVVWCYLVMSVVEVWGVVIEVSQLCVQVGCVFVWGEFDLVVQLCYCVDFLDGCFVDLFWCVFVVWVLQVVV